VICYRTLCEDIVNADLPPVKDHGDIFMGVAAHQIMTPLVGCLCENDTIGQAAEFLVHFHTNSSPVVDGDGKLCGVLSERDLLAIMTQPDCCDMTIRDVMRSHVVFYPEEASLRSIYDFLCRVSIRRVVIVKDGKPTGTISRGTLLRWFRDHVTGKELPPPARAGRATRTETVAGRA
jgi:CBS domain-containing protein